MKPADRYATSSLPEAQFEPGSRGRVLRNRLGIKSKREMEETEAVALKIAIDKLVNMYDNDHRFTAEDIRTMHKIWLRAIYDWAGEYRQVNVSKGDFHFAAAQQIARLMSALQDGSLSKHTPCNYRAIGRVIKALAEVHVELVLIHPFREGNGRVARILSTLMAFQAGLPVLNFKDITGLRRKDYFSAIKSGLGSDYKPMERLFEKIIYRSLKSKTAGL